MIVAMMFKRLGGLALAVLLFGAAMFWVSLVVPSAAQTSASPRWWQEVSRAMVCKAAENDRTICDTPVIGSRGQPLFLQESRVMLFNNAPVSADFVAEPGMRPMYIDVQMYGQSDEFTYVKGGSGRHMMAGLGTSDRSGSDCPAAVTLAADTLRSADVAHGGQINIVKCVWFWQLTPANRSLTKVQLYFTVADAKSVTASNCTTALLKGLWRAEAAGLAKTGHAVAFAAAANVPKHDGEQVAQRGVFSTYPAHKDTLSLLPTPLFSAARAFDVGNDQCLIPVVSQRDSGSSRSAILLDTKTSTLRFLTDNAYRWTGKEYSLYPGTADNRVVGGLEGRWVRGAAAALPKTCTPADFNGRWDRSDGARITIRGAGSDGVGGYASMDENPGDWVQGQHKYVSMRMKSACVYTAKCYASQRTSTNGVRDFKMVETACELVIDPATKRMTERGTSNSYSYTKAGMGAATRKPPSAATPPEPAQPSQAVQALNSEQAAAAKREIQAYEARKKAIADEQAAKEAAYRKALADREALIAENNRRAAEARAKWEASAAACRAGDQSQCALQPQR